MQRSWMLGSVAGLLLASVLWARPGTVKTRDGQVFVGEVTEESDQVVVDNKGIHTTIARDNLRSITYSTSIDQEYQKRLAKLTQYDVPGRLELARWVFENQRYDLAQAVLQEAIRIQPHNDDVIRMTRTVARQLDLAQAEARKHAPVQLAAADNNAPVGGKAAAPVRAPAGRLLSPEEINFISQSEWVQDQLVHATFKNDVRRKYIAQQGIEPVTFNRLTPPQQAWAIVQNGTKDMKKDVIVSDPPAILGFKRVQQSILASGCANCHSGEKAAGGFWFHYPADTEPATCANFLILQKYSQKIGDRVYSMIDRERPDDSLLIQFSMPPELGIPPHPKAPNYHGAVHTRNDPRLKAARDWINSLNPIVPDYSEIDLASPAATPAGGAAPPTSRPAAPRAGK
jgi:hypothetical protein